MRVYHGPRTVFGRMLIFTALIVLILPVGALTGSRGTAEQVRNGGRGDLSDISYYPLDLDLPELPPHHVIICPDLFMDEAKPLARWRTRLGLPSRIYSIDEIDSLFEGRDREERVHNFLRQLHQNHTTFKWLLILGDAEYLSPRPLWHYAYERIHDPKETDYSNFYRSDAYYAGLDSDWDENGNGRYGEINGTGEGDLNWDVYVGRVPASNETQAANHISKLIRYEGNPVIGSWAGRFLNWGSVMEPPNNLNTGSPHVYLDYNSNAYKVCERIRENLPPYIENRSLYDYPRLPGGSYQVGGASDTLDRSHMLSEFNKGASMLNFVGQARYNANALNDYGAPHPLVKNGDEYYWNEPLRYTDHSIFTNGDMMPFMYASTCDTAKFFEYDDSSLETWLTSSYGGVIGMISATGISYRGEEANRSWGNWYLVERFWRIFLNEGFTRPGQALKIQKDGYRSEWYRQEFVYKEAVLGMIYSYILLGDPWVDVHTGQVKRFMGPEWLDLDLFAGEHTYRFQVLDNSDPPSPVSEPTVAIYSPSIYEVVKGNSTGWVEVSLDLVEGEEVNLTYTGHNKIPRTHRKTVLEEISDVAILVEDVILDPPQPMVGEETTLSVGVKNLGGMVAEDVVLRLKILGGEEGDPDVVYNPVLLGDIDQRGEASHEFTWKVRAGHHFLALSAYSPSEDLDPLNNELVLPVFREGPMFEFSPGTGILLPSEKVRPSTDMQVYYTVFNSGNGSGELDLRLYLGNPEEGGDGMGEVLHAGAVHPGGWSNGTLSFRSPNGSGVIYMVMDPEARYPPGMVGECERVLLEIDHPPSVIRSLSMTMPEDTADQAVGVDRAVEDGETITLELNYRVVSAPNLTCGIERRDTGILLHVTPDPDWYGNTTALVGVSDMLGEVFMPVRVEVKPVNDPPRFRDHSGGRPLFTLVEDREFTTAVEAYDIETWVPRNYA